MEFYQISATFRVLKSETIYKMKSYYLMKDKISVNIIYQYVTHNKWLT